MVAALGKLTWDDIKKKALKETVDAIEQEKARSESGIQGEK